MSFIKVCPEYSKQVDFYGTRPEWSEHVNKGEFIEVPLYSLKDGTEYCKEPTTIKFPRVGEYEVKTMILSSQRLFNSQWTNENFFRVLSFTWTYYEDSKTSTCIERIGNFFPHAEAGLFLGAKATSDVTFEAVVVTVHYLES